MRRPGTKKALNGDDDVMVGHISSDGSDGTDYYRYACARARVASQTSDAIRSVSGGVDETTNIETQQVGGGGDAILGGRGRHGRRVLPGADTPAVVAAPEKTLVEPCKSKVVAVVELSPHLSELALPSAGARMAELGEILAAGYSRLLARKSRGKSAQTGESALDFTSTQSGHPTSATRRTADA